MSLVLHDPDLVGDVDSEAEERDEFHMEELLKEWTDEPPIRHDMYPESDDEEKTERFDTDIRREAVVDYALKTGCNIKQYRYDKDKIGFICVGCDGKKGGAKCEWKIYAAILPSDNMWKIRKFVDTYSCIPNGECEMFKKKSLGNNGR
ncbi:putative core-binding factor, beta subunit superfamily [Arabidopsis thaliana]